ncbi:MAG: hypothetical protein R3208_05685 [Ketobacteraceae bacterium]|nr:hypothetical protein [Ketobacteraceae bacterium]
MSLFQPKESFFNGSAPEDEVFRLGPHGCEVMFTSYSKGTVVGPSINTLRTKHIIINGTVVVDMKGTTKTYRTGESFEIPRQCEHRLHYQQDCSIIEFWFDK